MNFYKKIYSLYLSEIEEAKPGQDDAIMNTTTREMSSNGLLSFKTLDGGDEDIYETMGGKRYHDILDCMESLKWSTPGPS